MRDFLLIVALLALVMFGFTTCAKACHDGQALRVCYEGGK